MLRTTLSPTPESVGGRLYRIRQFHFGGYRDGWRRPGQDCRSRTDVQGRQLLPGGKATGVLRYEHVRLLPFENSQGLPATVTDVSFQGATYRVAAKMDNGAQLIAEKAGESTERPHASGERVRLGWTEHNLTVFADDKPSILRPKCADALHDFWSRLPAAPLF